MRSWRHSRLVKTVIMILLLWTAADLTNTSLCALESEDSRPTQVENSAPGLSEATQPRPLPEPVGHFDDCFCCSHCVEVQPVFPPAAGLRVAPQRAPMTAPAVRIFGFPLYHPPL